jgi:uracil-DNA glycosylase family 4
MLIIGLAPGMHGANRTGRPFTGDSSGDFLFKALLRAGFASSEQAAHAKLIGVRITNAVKCLPPENRPVAAEIANCAPYLAEELRTLCGERPRRARVVLCLGRLAHEAALKALALGVGADRGQAGSSRSELPAFAHGRRTEMARNIHLLDTYHPSRQNTNTGRLTEEMLDDVLATARQLLER